MKKNRPGRTAAIVSAGLVAAALASPASAIELYNQDSDELHFDGLAIFGFFDSQRNYDLLGTKEPGGSSWREGFANYGFTGAKGLGEGAALYGRISLLSSGTWGDGDAGGITSGKERRTAVEDAYLGWRSGNLFPALGEDGIDFSFGRQRIVFGDGFLINGDALNFGDALDRVAGTDFNRGGGYWVAARKAYDKTAVLRLGGAEGLRADLYWLESDNKVQAKTEVAGINVEHVSDLGTFAGLYIHGLDVDGELAEILGLTHRDGQKTLSLRYQGNAGVENLFLSAEFARQRQGDATADDASGWYVEGGWTFADLPWSPSASYRYSRFDRDFDPLFFGFNRGYGTWFQGEVAANFAGPFNNNTRVHYVKLGATPLENLELGVNLFNFRRVSSAVDPNTDAREIDVFALWAVHDNLIVSPLIGYYKPKVSADQGGTQLGSNKSNRYMHLLFIMPF